ncbi:hypothetical protein DFJ63DRAFT_315527 [Scheffersomyces coipomensis]|uniref:uncharacterized protein n=1 Tax=Scheffersomyces coipomensis TaxID=1788519 RepID=UPI00315D87F8
MFSNLSVDEFIDKVLRCDEEILQNVSVLEFFNSDALTDITDSMLRNFKLYSTSWVQNKITATKDPKELERADRIFLELCFSLRSYWKSRSRALLLSQTYEKDYIDLTKKLQLVDEANTHLKESDSLRDVLGIIRSVGNFMNDTSKQALGFKLDTLQRLKFMKDDKNSMNFLDYIEKIVRNSFPEYGAFVDELSCLSVIQNISVEQLREDCEEFGKSITNARTSIAKGNLSDKSKMHPKENVLSVVDPLLEKAAHKNALLQAHLKRTMKVYYSLMEFFGENTEDSAAVGGFFNKIVVFVNEFKKAHIENIQREEEERAYEAKKKAIEDSIKKIKKNQEKTEQNNLDDSEDSTTEDNVVINSDREEETDDLNAKDGSSAVIDNLLERLKSSASSIVSSSSRDRKSRDRRSKALSFYSSVSYDDILMPHDTNISESGSLPLPTTASIEYESVNSLKRRLTERRRIPDQTNSDSKTDQIMLRAHSMLHQLRTEGSESSSILDEMN